MSNAQVALSVVAFLASITTSGAGDLRVKDLRAYLFYSSSGALSENIVGSTKNFDNTVIGEGEGGGAASNVLIDLVLMNGDGLGPPTSATLKVSWRAMGKDTSLTRTYDNTTLNAGEVRHESVLIENATCWPVKIEARAGKFPPKIVTLKFSCGE
jgi:hypothetical protein